MAITRRNRIWSTTLIGKSKRGWRDNVPRQKMGPLADNCIDVFPNLARRKVMNMGCPGASKAYEVDLLWWVDDLPYLICVVKTLPGATKNAHFIVGHCGFLSIFL